MTYNESLRRFFINHDSSKFLGYGPDALIQIQGSPHRSDGERIRVGSRMELAMNEKKETE